MPQPLTQEIFSSRLKSPLSVSLVKTTTQILRSFCAPRMTVKREGQTQLLTAEIIFPFPVYIQHVNMTPPKLGANFWVRLRLFSQCLPPAQSSPTENANAGTVLSVGHHWACSSHEVDLVRVSRSRVVREMARFSRLSCDVETRDFRHECESWKSSLKLSLIEFHEISFIVHCFW